MRHPDPIPPQKGQKRMRPNGMELWGRGRVGLGPYNEEAYRSRLSSCRGRAGTVDADLQAQITKQQASCESITD
jgi:hypothetical protein